MCRKKELEPLRQSLRNNLWRIINQESIKTIPFMEFLMDILIDRHREIRITRMSFLRTYRDRLREQYAQILDYIQSNVMNGNIIGLENYIKRGINGNITAILDEFISNYEKDKNNH